MYHRKSASKIVLLVMAFLSVCLLALGIAFFAAPEKAIGNEAGETVQQGIPAETKSQAVPLAADLPMKEATGKWTQDSLYPTVGASADITTNFIVLNDNVNNSFFPHGRRLYLATNQSSGTIKLSNIVDSQKSPDNEENNQRLFNVLKSRKWSLDKRLDYWGNPVSSGTTPTMKVSGSTSDTITLQYSGVNVNSGEKIFFKSDKDSFYGYYEIILLPVKVFDLPTVNNPTYDGKSKNWTTDSFNIGGKNVIKTSGTPSATNAGSYSVSYSLDTTYYDMEDNKVDEIRGKKNRGVVIWSDGSTTASKSASWSIKKATYDMSKVKWTNTSLTYTGKQQSVTIASGLPSGVTVKTYSGNTATTAGENYTAKVTEFNYDKTNYNAPSLPSTTWKIAKANYNTSGLVWGNSTFNYTGSPQSVTLTSGTIRGVNGETLNPTGYTDNTKTDAGNYTAIAQYNWDKTNYNDPNVRKSWSIAKVNRTIEIKNQSAIYSGAEPTVQQRAGTDYAFSSGQGFLGSDGWDDITVVLKKAAGVNANKYAITGTATSNNYNIQFVEGQYTIQPKDISKDTTIADIDSLTYNGKAQTPTPSVSNTAKITPNDYTVTYQNNKNAGEATLILTGKGNFTGTVSKKFQIDKKDIADDVQVTISGEFVYNGSAHTPEVTLNDPAAAITPDDYTLRYSNNVNAGQATVTIEGKGNYNGGRAEYFTIKPKNIADGTTIEKLGEFVYTGSEQTPAPTVSNVANITTNDYTVSYADNKNVGDATVTLTGKGNFTGTTSATFKITPKEVSVEWNGTQFKYDGEGHKPTATAQGLGEDGMLTLEVSGEQVNAGDYSATASLADNEVNKNYVLANTEQSFNIAKRRVYLKPAEGISLQYGDEFDGTNKSYWEFTSDGGYDLPIESDVSALEPRVDKLEEAWSVGNYTLEAKLTENANYEITCGKGSMQITSRRIVVEVPDASAQYGDKDAELTFNLAKGSSLGHSDQLSDLNISLMRQTGTAVGDYNIFTSYRNSNYNITFNTGVYRIVPREITINIENVTKQYGDVVITPTQWSLASGSKMAYNESTDVLKIALSKEGGAAEKGVKDYRITGTWNNKSYNVTFVEGTYKITPKNITIVIKNRSSIYGEALADLTDQASSWDLKLGSAMAYGEDLSVLNVVLTKADGLNVGKYAITGEWNNGNYNVTFEEGEYSITPASFDVEVNPYFGVYDGEAHGVTVKAGGLEGVKVQYSTDNADWKDTLLFTDAVNGQIVYVKVSRPNYFDYFSSATVTIEAKELSVEWSFPGVTSTNYTWSYDGTQKTPVATVNTGIDGVNVTLAVTGGQTNASDKPYTAVAAMTEQNNNFVLTNTEHVFYIVRARIGVTVNQPDLDATIYTNGKLPDLTLSSIYSQLGKIEWNPYVLRADQKTYGWTFTPNDRQNYEIETGEFTFNNIVEVAATGIEVNADGADKAYIYGDKMNGEGIVVTVVFNDGSRQTVTGYTFKYENGGSFFFAGESAVTVVVDLGADKVFEQEISGITVDKKTVEVPEARVLTFNKENQQISFVEGTNTDLFNVNCEFQLNAGTYTATLTLKDANNYKWTSGDTAEVSVEWTIEALTPNIEPQVDNNKTIYTDDDALPALTLPEEYRGIGTIEWDAYVISTANRVYTWTFTPNEANANNYTVVTGEVRFNDIRVRQVLNVKITKNPDKMTYNAFDTLALDGMELTVTFDGGKQLVKTDGFEIRYQTGNSFRAGDVSVTVVYSDGTSEHTVILTGLTVNKIAVQAPSAGSTTFEYDKTEKKLGIADSDQYTLSGDVTKIDVGNYATTITLSDPNNYKWADTDEASFVIEWSITPKSITININNATSVYGDDFAELTWQLADGSSLAVGDTEEGLGIVLTKADGKAVNTYAITGECTNKNYTVEFVEGTYTVTKKTLNVKVDNAGSNYGDPDARLTWSLEEGSELAYGENAEVLGVTLKRDDGNGVGSYNIYLTYDNENYQLNVTSNGKYTISPRPITIVIKDQTSVYGAAFADLTLDTAWELKSGSTLAFGDKKNVLAVKLTKESGRDAKTYAITGTWSNANYAVTFENGTYTITPKSITVEIFDQTSVYGQALKDLTGMNCWNFAAGSAMAYGEGKDVLDVTLSKADGLDVGNYAISGVSGNGNYNVTFVPGNYEITKADRVAEVRPYNGIYDGKAHSVSVVTQEGDTVWYSTERNGAYTQEPVSYTDVVNGATVYIKITNKNYNDYYADNTVTIAAKELTVVWKGNQGSEENFVYTYDGKTVFCPTAEVNTGIDGITLKVTVTGGQTQASEKPYTAEASIDNANFVLKNPTQEFYVNGMELSIQVKPAVDTDTPIYAYGKLPELRLSDEEKLLGTIAWDTYTITKDQVVYTWTFTPNSPNYAKQHGSVTFKTVVERFVTGITVDDGAVKKDYTAFDTFNPEGLKVLLHFTDGTEEYIDYATGKFVYESGTYFLVGQTKITFVYTAQAEGGEKQFEAEITGITVSKKAIDVPVQDGTLTYNKETQSPNIAESEYYTITGNSAIDAGTYQAELTLSDPANTMWSDTHDSTNRSVKWTIERATPSVNPTVDTVTAIYTSGTLPELGLTAGEKELGTIAWDEYKLSTDKKTYTWTFTPKDTKNYTVATGSVTFQSILEDTLESISVDSQPIDKTYTAFEKLSVEQLKVTATYKSGTTKDVTGELTFKYQNGENFRVGDTSVTVVYESNGVTKEAVITGITVNPVQVMRPTVEEGKKFTYSGSEITAANVSGNEYTVNGDVKATNAGNYTFTITLKDKVNYVWTGGGSEDITVNWSIEKATINTDTLKFENVTVTYDGQSHSIEVSGLPAGVTVTYEGNDKTDAGEYTVTAKFNVGENYNAIGDMTAKLTINKATLDMSGVKFDDVTVTYDGQSHSIEVSGLPEGVTVTYEGNGKTEVGEYTVTAKFDAGKNYNAIGDMTAKLTIKAEGGAADPGNNNTGLIIGLAAGGVVVVGLAIAIVVIVRKKKKGAD